jgi:hypothetical protein
MEHLTDWGGWGWRGGRGGRQYWGWMSMHTWQNAHTGTAHTPHTHQWGVLPHYSLSSPLPFPHQGIRSSAFHSRLLFPHPLHIRPFLPIQTLASQPPLQGSTFLQRLACSYGLPPVQHPLQPGLPWTLGPRALDKWHSEDRWCPALRALPCLVLCPWWWVVGQSCCAMRRLKEEVRNLPWEAEGTFRSEKVRAPRSLRTS